MLFVVFGFISQNVRYFEKLSVNVQTGNLLMLLFAGLRSLSVFPIFFPVPFCLLFDRAFYTIRILRSLAATS